LSDASLHPHEELQELLDARLSDEQRALVEVHLASCEACQRELSELRFVRLALRTLSAAELDSGFNERLRAALDLVDRESEEWKRPPLRRVRAHGWLFAAMAVAAAVATFLFWTLVARGPAGIPAAAMSDFRAVRTGQMQLFHTAILPAELEQQLARDGLHFRLRVLDLSMMRWELRGGGLSDLRGRQAGLFVYRSAAGRIVVCEMFEGRLQDLPPEAKRFEHDGILFLVYRERDLTAVFWSEGDLLCVLVSDLPSAELQALAVAKAMRPA